MPSSSPTRSGAFHRIWLPACLIVVAAGTYGFLQLGSFLVVEDPLQKADAILALAGTRISRQLEAAELYLQGYGRYIVLSREAPEAGERALAKRGIDLPDAADSAKEVFVRLGVPRDNILVPPRVHNSTAAEAVTLRELAAAHRWRRVIVVSSRYHLRRAAFAFRRELKGTDVEVVMRGTLYDGVDPEHWWRHRGDIRVIGPEVPKLVAYVLGLGA